MEDVLIQAQVHKSLLGARSMRLPPTLDVWLIGDSEEAIASLAAESWVTLTYSSVESFRRQLIASAPGCVVVNCRSNQQSGLDLIRDVHATTWPAPAILIAEGETIALKREAERNGILDVISPPIDLDQLRSIISFARQLALEALREFYRSE